jgi:hypothetical protein
MGMTTLSELFPQAEILKPGQTRDPSKLKRLYLGTSGSIQSITGVSTYNNMTSNGFHFVNAGAHSTAATDDTFTTVCDITGSGTLYGVVSQSPTNTTDDITFRITIDGVVTTIVFSETFPNAGGVGCRGILGDIVSIGGPARSFANNSGVPTYYGNDFDEGNGEYRFANAQSYMVSTDYIELMNGTRVIFDTDMKVEVKVTDVLTTSPGTHALASYVLGVQT